MFPSTVGRMVHVHISVWNVITKKLVMLTMQHLTTNVEEVLFIVLKLKMHNLPKNRTG